MPKKKTHGGRRPNSGRDPLPPMEKKYTVTMQVPLKYIAEPETWSAKEKEAAASNAIERAKNKLIDKGILDAE